MKTYTALCEPGERWWAIEIPEVPQGAYTQARRLGDVEHMARDLLSLIFEVPEDSFRVVVKPQLGPELDAAVARARKARVRAERAQHEAAEASTVAVTNLLALGLSMREAGQILGLSHQRVAQIAAARLKASGDPERPGLAGQAVGSAEYPPAATRRRPSKRVAER
jgi:hypothetical protein